MEFGSRQAFVRLSRRQKNKLDRKQLLPNGEFLAGLFHNGNFEWQRVKLVESGLVSYDGYDESADNAWHISEVQFWSEIPNPFAR